MFRRPTRPTSSLKREPPSPSTHSTPDPASTSPIGHTDGFPIPDTVRNFLRQIAAERAERDKALGDPPYVLANKDDVERRIRAGDVLLFRCTAQNDHLTCQVRKGDVLVYLVRAKAPPKVGEAVVFEVSKPGPDRKPHLACGKVIAFSEDIVQIEIFSPQEGKATVTLLDASALRGPVISVVRPLD
jgi:hypothetical protein